jgi:hypothetical protein
MTMSAITAPRARRATTRATTRNAPIAATTQAARSDDPAHAPLSVLEDQRQLWLAHGDKPISFESAVERVLAEREADGARTDQLADLRAYGFGAVDGVMAIKQGASLDLHGDGQPIRLRKRAFRDLCSLVKVDPTFIASVPAQLAAVNMNWLMTHGPLQSEGARFFRRAGGDLRSIHSDRYAALDDDILLEIADEVLRKSGYRADAMVRASCIGPQMTLRISIPNEGVEIKAGDVIEWGLDLGNSEVGMRSVQVTPSTYRQICLNGLRSTELGAVTRIRHVGDHREIRDDLTQAIPAAFAEARGDIARWQKSVDMMVTDALADLEGLAGFGIEKSEQRAIGRMLIGAEQDMPNQQLAEALRHRRTTVYDMTNAITATARDRGDVGDRMSLEETAHRYLTRRTA